MQKEILRDGNILELIYSGGGATNSDIIWIKKITKEGKEVWIGKIKDFSDSDEVKITEVDSSHISLTFVTSLFPEYPVIFRIDLNNRIKRDATSPFNEPERKL
jgi:hypothetical protein